MALKRVVVKSGWHYRCPYRDKKRDFFVSLKDDLTKYVDNKVAFNVQASYLSRRRLI